MRNAARPLTPSRSSCSPAHTKEGNFWHKDNTPQREEVWLDGTYMAQPFYMEYGPTTTKMQGCVTATSSL